MRTFAAVVAVDANPFKAPENVAQDNTPLPEYDNDPTPLLKRMD